MTDGYCPKCGSRLYPGDTESMEIVGVCSSCVCYDRTPDKRLQKALEEGKAKRAKIAKVCAKRQHRLFAAER